MTRPNLIEDGRLARLRVPLVLGAFGLFGILGATACDDGGAKAGGNALVKVSPEAKGTNCPAGGQRIDTGLDKNQNTVLEAAEITASSYVCGAAAANPIAMQRAAWSQTANPISMNNHSDDLVATAPIGSGRLTLKRLSHTPYNVSDFGRSASETVDFNPITKQIFTHDTWHGRASYVTVAADGALTNPGTVDPKISLTDLPVGGGPYILGVNSVAVKENTMALVVEVFDTTLLSYVEGRLVVYDVSAGTAPAFIAALKIGPQGDHVSFTPDGSKMLVAGEGEPATLERTHSEILDVADPEGTISVISRPAAGWKALTSANVVTIGFQDFNDGGARAAERPPELHRIAKEGIPWSQQFEPEYISYTADSTTAFVVLQEVNAFAIVDLTKTPPYIKEIHHLGFKDGLLPGNEFDASRVDGRVRLANWPVFLMYQPDTIKGFVGADSKNYFATVNEGDIRDPTWGWHENEKISLLNLDPVAFPNQERWKQDDMLGELQVTTTKGDADGDGLYENLYAFGGRSFSIWDEQGNIVFDSGNMFERTTAALFGSNFNDFVKEWGPEGNSPIKGPEPEALSVGVIRVPKKVPAGKPPAFEDRTYAFIGSEKICGWWVYDVTNPAQAEFVTYFTTRNPEIPPFDDALDGADLSPEGSVFVSAADSPTGKPLLIAGNEVSSTTSVYEIEVAPL